MPTAGWVRWMPVLALGAAACASAPATPRPHPDEVRGILGRDCRFADPPDRTPPLAAIARPGVRGNVALWGLELAEPDTVELSVRYGEDGRLLWVEPIRATVDEEHVATLGELIFGALEETARADWGVRILVVAGDVAAVAPSVICEPESRSPGAIRPNIEAVRDFYLVEGRRYPVEIGLDERGNVIGVRLLRETRSRAVDQFIRDYVWNSSFEPKLHDGIGLPSTLRTHVEFPRIRR
ncbi:MAG: hypothetical protein R3314_05345 [Longimicrobiales bacterium]|nr:hypothetical protein [Longimicrobiales bacterium]